MGRSTVLIVAESHPDPDLNVQFLRQANLRLLTCENDATALDTAKAERPALIIEDLSSNGEPTAGLCRRLREDAVTARTPLILVSPASRLGEARDTGADELLCKPLIPGVFYEAVRQYVPLPERCQLRYKVNLRFTFPHEGRVVQAFSRDISLAGVFLKTDRAISPGTHIDLTFVLPGHSGPIRCGGRVRRLDDTAPKVKERGVGVEFEGIRDADLERLELYITRSAYRPRLFR